MSFIDGSGESVQDQVKAQFNRKLVEALADDLFEGFRGSSSYERIKDEVGKALGLSSAAASSNQQCELNNGVAALINA